MDKLVIEGGVPLAGEVAHLRRQERGAADPRRGAPHRRSRCTVTNVPHLRDVTTMLTLLAQMGVAVSMDEKLGVELTAARIASPVAPYELVKTMRASVLVLGPLAARCGEARVSLPGRLRDRAAAGRPAHQGPAGDGRGDRDRARLHARARAAADAARASAWIS